MNYLLGMREADGNCTFVGNPGRNRKTPGSNLNWSYEYGWMPPLREKTYEANE